MHFLNIHKLIRQDISGVGNLGTMLVPVSGAISYHLKEMKYFNIFCSFFGKVRNQNLLRQIHPSSYRKKDAFASKVKII